MNKKIQVALLVIFACFTGPAFSQVPKMGNDTLLDLMCWNIEWFGDATAGNGPDDEVTQFNNVKAVLSNVDVDVISLEEVSDLTAWANLKAALPAYAGTITTYSQTQKTALLWKKDMFDILSSQSVLAQSQYSYDFASRPPLEVMLRSKDSLARDTIYFYVIHLKAYADQTSYGRRKNAADDLKAYLDANMLGKKFVVMGDWNDELNGSTISGNTTPFQNFLSDTNYFYICKQLSDQGKKSYAYSSGKMIDHIMISRPLKDFYVNASSKVLDVLPNYISGYSNNTSDHYPVMGFFNMKRIPGPDTTSHTGIADMPASGLQVQLFPNPSHGYFRITTQADVTDLKVTDMLGKTTAIKWNVSPAGFIEGSLNEDLRNGVYFITVSSGNATAQMKLVLQR